MVSSRRDAIRARSEALSRLHQASDLLERSEDRALVSEAGISYQQFSTLLTIKESEPPVSESVIASKMQRNLNTVSMMIDRLEKAGLVVRNWSEEDRRTVHVSMTDLGGEKLTKGLRVRRMLIRQLAGALSVSEAGQLLRVLGKINDRLLKAAR